MKAIHKSGIGYIETAQEGDRLKRPGIDQVFIVHNPRPVGNGISFTAEIQTQTPGAQFVDVHWHRHELVMSADATTRDRATCKCGREHACADHYRYTDRIHGRGQWVCPACDRDEREALEAERWWREQEAQRTKRQGGAA